MHHLDKSNVIPYMYMYNNKIAETVPKMEPQSRPTRNGSLNTRRDPTDPDI
jgi:hypothetical protein